MNTKRSYIIKQPLYEEFHRPKTMNMKHRRRERKQVFEKTKNYYYFKE
jgi:hypothetical protein